jgi:hypothetical protein
MPITVHNNETLERLALRLEEHVFINCKLIECRLFYDGGPFEWTNASFQNCQFSFRGPAMTTIQALQSLGMMKQVSPPEPVVSGSSTVH